MGTLGTQGPLCGEREKVDWEKMKERCGLLIVHSYSYVETGGVSPLNQSRSNTSCNVIISVTFSVCKPYSFMSIT